MIKVCELFIGQTIASFRKSKNCGSCYLYTAMVK